MQEFRKNCTWNSIFLFHSTLYSSHEIFVTMLFSPFFHYSTPHSWVNKRPTRLTCLHATPKYSWSMAILNNFPTHNFILPWSYESLHYLITKYSRRYGHIQSTCIRFLILFLQWKNWLAYRIFLWQVFMLILPSVAQCIFMGMCTTAKNLGWQQVEYTLA